MVRILHISDTHAQQDTVTVLDDLVTTGQHHYDVIALTGDCVSPYTDHVPIEWDKWPQKLKLAVPGNHGDHSNAFSLLSTWVHPPPWVRYFGDLAFIGLNMTSEASCISFVASVEIDADTAAVVVLSHNRVRRDLGACLSDLAGPRKLLLLHGDEHPAEGVEWDVSGNFNGRKYYRSNVCSCTSSCKGLAQIIEWSNGSFAARPSQHPRWRTYIDL